MQIGKIVFPGRSDYNDILFPSWEKLFDKDFNLEELVKTLKPIQKDPDSNFYEKDNNWIYEFSLPGYKKENIEINILDGAIRLSGKKIDYKDESIEFYYSYKIPEGVSEKISASMEDGILKVVFEKEKKEEKTKKVEIK